MKNIIFSMLTITLLSVSACQPEQGCTDPDSINYSATAEENDGSCTYESSLVFWFNANTSLFFQNNYMDELKVYVDDILIGTMPSNSSYLSTPDCNAGGITYNANLGTAKTKTISFIIKYPVYYPEPAEYDYISGSLQIQGGHCQSYQIQ
ncbi:MAG: hypothetical protein K9I34_00130 [Bacteroidales bacterium]|nr:hypothetical protein [Bacteroidales bacterium]